MKREIVLLSAAFLMFASLTGCNLSEKKNDIEISDTETAVSETDIGNAGNSMKEISDFTWTEKS